MKQWSIVRSLIAVLSPIVIARTLYCARGRDNDNNRPYCSRGRLKSALQAALLPEECYDDFITAKSSSSVELCPRVGRCPRSRSRPRAFYSRGRKTSRVQRGTLIASPRNSRSPAFADYSHHSLNEHVHPAFVEIIADIEKWRKEPRTFQCKDIGDSVAVNIDMRMQTIVLS